MIRVIPMKTVRAAARSPRRSADARYRKVAISLPASLLSELERRRKATGASRSGFVAEALELYLRTDEAATRIREYVEGYRRMPETREEIEQANASAVGALAA